MCMYDASTDDPGEVEAWKVLAQGIEGDWWTPHQGAQVSGESLAAEGEPSFTLETGFRRCDHDHRFSELVSNACRTLHGGAIHCYRSKESARHKAVWTTGGKVFKVRGEGFVACNEKEIAYRKITFLEPLA